MTKPDKGKGVVLMNKEDYIDKMMTILDDSTKFRKIGGDIFYNVVRLEDKINRILRSIKDKIGSAVFSSLYASGTSPGVLYGLPKIHKQNNPLRPIISSINTAAYKIAKFLIPMITPFTNNQYTIGNSYNFIADLKNADLPSRFCMAQKK